MVKKQDDPVLKVLDAIKKRAGKRPVRLLSQGMNSDIDEVIPTGIDVLDHHVIGVGGWPVGRIVELYADEGVGKTSLLYQSLAGAQREGAIAALYENEHAMDSARAGVFGVDLDRLVGDQPDTMEDSLELIEATLESLPASRKGDPAALIGWDSLASSPTRSEVKFGLTGKKAVADRARIMSEAMRVLTRKVSLKRAVLIIVNQTRTKFGGWGDNTTTPGGAALKFHASLRIQLFGGKAIKVGDDHVGKQVTMMAIKTKVGGRPYAKAKVRLYYDTGWNNTWSTVWHAKDRGLVPKGATYDEASYVEALKALGWGRGFASGAEPVGEADDDSDGDVDRELLGEDPDGDDL